MYRRSCSTIRSLMPVVALIVGAALFWPSTALASEPVFSITGKGWGHGIGMSQYGARGYAIHDYNYDQIIKRYFTGSSLTAFPWVADLSKEPVVKVAIQKDNTPSAFWTVRSNNYQLAVDLPGGSYPDFYLPKGTYYTVCIPYADQLVSIRYVDPDTKLTRYVTATGQSTTQRVGLDVDWVEMWERDTSAPRYVGKVEVSNQTGPFGWGNLVYQGTVDFVRSTTNPAVLHIFNRIYIEDYIKSVVPREMAASWETEAVKAQAVAARSYAYSGASLNKRSDTTSFDMWCTTSSQVYNGWGRYLSAYSKVVRHGDDPNYPGYGGDYLSDPEVAFTRAVMATYGGSAIKTYFFSTSGGHTENIENVWQGTSMPSTIYPYYKGVPDEYEWDSGSPFTFSWGDPIEFTATALKAKLGSYAPAEIVGVRISARGVSGRAKTVRIYGADGTTKDVTGDTFRSKLGLRDTFYEITGGTARIEGESRYDTAVQISRNAFDSADFAVVANGSAFADALGASALAGAVPGGAPVLLTGRDTLYQGARDEIVRLDVSKVYVVGGDGVISDAVLAELRAITSPALTVVRLAGPTRYDTSARIAAEVHTLLGSSYDGRVILINGQRYADAVAASGLAYAKGLPIILTANGSVPAASATAISDLGATSALVVGGATVVPDAVAASLGITWHRIAAGTDRYDTAAKLAAYVTASEGFTWSRIYFVSGESLVDALSGGPLAGGYNAPMLFLRKDSVPTPTLNTVKAHLSADRYLLGGENAVSEATVQVLDQIH